MLGGSRQSAAEPDIEFVVSNGTYDYTILSPGWMASHSHGRITVVGLPISVIVRFEPEYSVEFVEKGLPNGSNWSVGSFLLYPGESGLPNVSSMAPSITDFLVSGLYTFEVHNTAGFLPAPAYGAVDVNASGSMVVINFDPPPISGGPPPNPTLLEFAETGLPGGTPWSVTADGITEATQGRGWQTANFSLHGGGYNYTVGAVPGFTATPSSGSVGILPGTARVVVNVSFRPESPDSYVVTAFLFTFGPVPATHWSVTLGGTTKSKLTAPYWDPGTISFGEPNGTYHFSDSVSPTFGSAFLVPTNGWVVVAGSSVSVVVNDFWTPSLVDTGINTTATYVTFDETGLPMDSNWSVAVNGLTRYAALGATSITTMIGGWFTVNPVSGYSAIPLAGYASPAEFPANIGGVYDVTFVPRGGTVDTVVFASFHIELGATWFVNLADTATGGPAGAIQGSIGSSSTSVATELPNGTYDYEVHAQGYTPLAPTGSFTIIGGEVSVAATFAPLPTFPLTFKERGLPVGMNWTVSVGSNPAVTLSTNSPIVAVEVPRGTTPIGLSPPRGYGVLSVSGPGSPTRYSVNVGGPSTFRVTFSPFETLSFVESSLPRYELPAGTEWTVYLNASSLKLGLPRLTEETNGSTLNFTALAGAHYRFAVRVTGGDYQASPSVGTMIMPRHPVTKIEKFGPISSG
ncbi:MAG: hypothetical protein WAK40_02105 [Thermoplasmata archaeon]